MHALFKYTTGPSPLFFYLNQTGCKLRYGEFFGDSPTKLAFEEESFDTVDQAMEAYTQHVTDRVNRGFIKTTLTPELQVQIEGTSAVDGSAFVRLPSISTQVLASFHEQLDPIFGAWKGRGVKLENWEGVLAFTVQDRSYAIRSRDEEGANTPLRDGTECIRCNVSSTLLRMTLLERYVLRIIFAVIARRFSGVEIMTGDNKIMRPSQVGMPNPDTVGLSDEGIEYLVARLRDANLLGPSTRIAAPPTGGASEATASSLAF